MPTIVIGMSRRALTVVVRAELRALVFGEQVAVSTFAKTGCFVVDVEGETLGLVLVAFLRAELQVGCECLGFVFRKIHVPLTRAAAHIVLLHPA